jgi:glycosyltransferase involved in cell wall biosynthesis
MKILQINKFYFLAGGTERYLFGLSEILEKNGHPVIPFSMQDPKNIPSEYLKYFIDPVKFQGLNFKNAVKIFHNYDAVRKLELLIKKEKPDIAHLHNIAHQLSPAIISVLKKHNIPVVQTLHDYKLICPNYKLFSRGKVCYKCQGGKYYNCFLRKCLKNSRAKSFLVMLEAYLRNTILKTYSKVDLFIAPSQFMKDISVGFGVPEDKIKVLRNPIEIENSKEDSERENYLLYFGRISSEKGIDILIQSLKNSKSKPNLKIVGAGLEISKYKKLVSELGLESKIEFMGPKYGKELEKIISRAKAVIIPSVWPENMPYSLLESMARGKVVIASRIGGMPELITDGLNGFLFEAGNELDLGIKIDELDKKDLGLIGQKAKETLINLNYALHADLMVGFYENLLGKPNK